MACVYLNPDGTLFHLNNGLPVTLNSITPAALDNGTPAYSRPLEVYDQQGNRLSIESQKRLCESFAENATVKRARSEIDTNPVLITEIVDGSYATGSHNLHGSASLPAITFPGDCDNQHTGGQVACLGMVPVETTPHCSPENFHSDDSVSGKFTK